MPHPITQISAFNYNNLNKELTNLDKPAKRLFDQMLSAYEDDFWQKGQGSLLPPPRGKHASVLQTLFERRFVFRNVLRECMERVSGAFYGKSPSWNFSVNNTVNDVTELTDEQGLLEKAMGEWWTRENIATTMAKAFESRLVTGRGGFRIFIPVKYSRKAKLVLEPTDEGSANGSTDEVPINGPSETTVVNFDSIEEALKAIKVEYVSPLKSKMLDDGGEIFTIVKYSIRERWDDTKSTNVIEYSFVDDLDQTFIGLLKEKNGDSTLENSIKSSPLELGGRPTFSEFKGEPYATAGLYKNNQLLNLALTCAGFSIVDNGFSEVFFTNVEVETEEVPDPSNTGSFIKIPKDIRRGGGTIQNLVGISQEDPNTGVETRLSPGVTFREPSQLTTFVQGKDLAYTACLEEVGQVYAKLSGDAVASGESRIQAMTDFWLRIRKYKPEVDEQGSFVMTAVLKFAAALCGQVEKYIDTVITYDSKVFIGQISTSEKQLVIQMRDSGLVSRETAQVLLGVEDPVLETETIISEQAETPLNVPLHEFDRKLDLALKMTGTLPPDFILTYLGFDSVQVPIVLAALDAQTAKQQQDILQFQDAQAGGGNSSVPTPAIGPSQ